MKRVEEKDIPIPSGGANGIDVLVSDKPLIIAWKERNKAIEQVVRTRALDFYDVHGGENALPFSEILDLNDERERAFRREIRWSVSRDAPHFKQAEQELYWIFNLYQHAHACYPFSLGVYEKKKKQLLDAGYPQEAIEAVPAPPAPLALLHMTNGCRGEVHKGIFKGLVSTYTYHGEEHHYTKPDEKHLFCPECRWVSGLIPPSIGGLLEDLGAEQITPDPNYSCSTYTPTIDLEVGDRDNGELRRAEEEGQKTTRRCMKVYGLLISVSEAAKVLNSTTQNVSNYIAKHRLRAWPDPDDTRYRLVLRSEVEALR